MMFYTLTLYSTEDSTLGLSSIPSSNAPQPIKDFLVSVIKKKQTLEEAFLSFLKQEESKHGQNEGWVMALRKSWEEDMERESEEGTEICEALASSAKRVRWTDDHHPNQLEADFLFDDGPIPPELSFLCGRHPDGELAKREWRVFPRSWTWGDPEKWLVSDEERARMKEWLKKRRVAKDQWETRNRPQPYDQYAKPNASSQTDHHLPSPHKDSKVPAGELSNSWQMAPKAKAKIRSEIVDDKSKK